MITELNFLLFGDSLELVNCEVFANQVLTLSVKMKYIIRQGAICGMIIVIIKK